MVKNSGCYIWIDESGDDGMRYGSSPYLVLGGLLVEDLHQDRVIREVKNLIDNHRALLKDHPLHLNPMLSRRHPYRYISPRSLIRFLDEACTLLGSWRISKALGTRIFVFAMKKHAQNGVAQDPIWFHALVLHALLSAFPRTGAVHLHVDNEARRNRFLQAILRLEGCAPLPWNFRIEVVNWRHDVMMQMADMVTTLGYLDAAIEDCRAGAQIRTLHKGWKTWQRRALRGLEVVEPPGSVRGMVRGWLNRMGVQADDVMIAETVRARIASLVV